MKIKPKNIMAVTAAFFMGSIPIGMSLTANAADAGGTFQSDKSQQPGLPDGEQKHMNPAIQDPTTKPPGSESIQGSKAPTGMPGRPGPTAPGTGGSGPASPGGGSSSGGSGSGGR